CRRGSRSRSCARRGRRTSPCRPGSRRSSRLRATQSGLSQTRHFGCTGLGIATTRPCKTGNGGVLLSLCSMMSNARQAFLPSNFTSNENSMNSALPLILLDTTPPPALPASSPVLILKFESLTQVDWPSHLTFFVPCAVSLDIATFGYGIGIGPAGDGVLQTSGNAIDVPLLDACATERKLTPTVAGMSLRPSVDLDGAALDAVRLGRTRDDARTAYRHAAVTRQDDRAAAAGEPDLLLTRQEQLAAVDLADTAAGALRDTRLEHAGHDRQLGVVGIRKQQDARAGDEIGGERGRVQEHGELLALTGRAHEHAALVVDARHLARPSARGRHRRRAPLRHASRSRHLSSPLPSCPSRRRRSGPRSRSSCPRSGCRRSSS